MVRPVTLKLVSILFLRVLVEGSAITTLRIKVVLE